MPKIRALIVDDEPIARRGIRSQLLSEPEIEIIGECANGLEAVAAIQERSPNLVFLDVQMPEMDGFEVIQAVGVEHMPTVVFVTAYDRYALRAFEVHAVDYLLKPFDRGRFVSALDHAKSHIERRETGTLKEQLLALLEEHQGGRRHLERLVVKSAGRICFLGVSEIDWIEAADNYAELHVGKRSHLVRQTLGHLEARLDPKEFVRIRHSTIVNVKKIQELRPSSGGEYDVVLHSGEVLAVISIDAGAAPPRAAWLWENDAYRILDEKPARDEALRFLTRKGIGTVYFYADAWRGRNAIADQSAKLRAVIGAMHKRGLRVFALLGSEELKTQEYVLPERRDRAIAMFERVLDYDRDSKPHERFDGVNLDIEPYLLGDWAERKEELARDYLDLGAVLMDLKRSRDPKLVVGPAMPFWWDGIEDLTWNGRTARLNEHVQDLYDYVSLMDYRNFAKGGDGMIAHAEDELAYGSKIGKPVWIGIETLPGDPAKLTFHGKTEAALERELALVANRCRSERAFAGFVIHHFSSYRDWLAAQASSRGQTP